jgi:hypothetical protein
VTDQLVEGRPGKLLDRGRGGLLMDRVVEHRQVVRRVGEGELPVPTAALGQSPHRVGLVTDDQWVERRSACA